MADEWGPVRQAAQQVRLRLDEVIASTVTVLRSLPTYDNLPPESLQQLLRRNVALGLEVLEEERCYTDAELALLVETVAERARQGVSLATTLEAFSLAEEQVFLACDEQLTSAPLRLLRRFWALRLRKQDQLTRAVAVAHRHVELELAAESEARLALALQALLSEGVSEREAVAILQRLGMDAARPHWVWRARPDGDSASFVNAVLGGPERAPLGIFTTWDGDVVGLSSSPPPVALPQAIGGVAGPVPVTGLHGAFVEASHVRHTVSTFGLHGVHARSSLGLLAAVTADPLTGKALQEKYLVPLAGAGALADDLLTTVGVYLDCARRRDAAGARLHLHPNSVTYRVGRFVHFTGADLDDPTTLAEIWWLRQHLAAQDGPSGTTF